MTRKERAILPYFIIFLASCLLVSCGTGFFDKDNMPTPTPLTSYRAEVHPQLLWGVRTGGKSSKDYLKLSLSSSPSTLFTTSLDGIVTAVAKNNGHILWQQHTNLALSAGAGYGDGIVVVASRKGEILALSAVDGHTLWRTTIEGSVLAQPAISHGAVIIKTSNGLVKSFSASNGQESWDFTQEEPNLILHTASAPIIRGDGTVLGFANGNLIKLNTYTGQTQWQQSIATPEGAFEIERMVDIDADPILFGNTVYVATYQGQIAALDYQTGQPYWTHGISSYTGMAADEANVFVSDAHGLVWSFGADNGLVNWQQNQLAYRNTTGPALMGSYVVVGDSEGFLHWLSKRDGHFAGRVSTGGNLFTPPLVENNVLYAITKSGYLTAYIINTQ